MKINIHKSGNRSFRDYGWLKTWHSFNFADYFNPLRERFGIIRVLNDEIIEPDSSFDPHEHKNMEILLLPLNGELKFKDHAGIISTVMQDEVLIVSAGSGINYSFGNNSDSQPLEILQIWLFPKIKDIEPRYQCLQFNERERKGKFQVIVSPEIISDVLWINQQTWISRIDLYNGQSIQYHLQKDNNILMIFVIDGSIHLTGGEDVTANRRDTLEVTEINDHVDLIASDDAKLLFIEVPVD